MNFHANIGMCPFKFLKWCKRSKPNACLKQQIRQNDILVILKEAMIENETYVILWVLLEKNKIEVY